jgi:hypothetical protein
MPVPGIDSQLQEFQMRLPTGDDDRPAKYWEENQTLTFSAHLRMPDGAILAL